MEEKSSLNDTRPALEVYMCYLIFQFADETGCDIIIWLDVE